MALRKVVRHMQRNETESPSYTVHKINSKWIKDLSIRPGNVKITEENIRSTFFDIILGNDFLDLTPKQRQQKQK